jgi:hypothetical protein
MIIDNIWMDTGQEYRRHALAVALQEAVHEAVRVNDSFRVILSSP